jgi:hypothetical protein
MREEWVNCAARLPLLALLTLLGTQTIPLLLARLALLGTQTSPLLRTLLTLLGTQTKPTAPLAFDLLATSFHFHPLLRLHFLYFLYCACF